MLKIVGTSVLVFTDNVKAGFKIVSNGCDRAFLENS